MRKLAYLLSLLFFISCNKNSEDEPAILVIQAMTNGQWKVTDYQKGSENKTADFAPYKFQFKTNLTVDAINNNAYEKTGTWTADADAGTISSSFSSATATVTLLNGTWIIKKTTWTSVNAVQTVGGEERILRLEKL